MPATPIDSDMVVWLTRGQVGAAQRLHARPAWRISAVSYMALAQGCPDKADLAPLKQGLEARNTEIVPITPAISELAAQRHPQGVAIVAVREFAATPGASCTA